MPRTPKTPTAPAAAPKLNEAALAALEAAPAQLAAVQAGYGQDRDLLNQLLGQAQAFHAAGNLLRTFGVSKLAFVKESKLYQQLRGQRAPNGSEFRGTWEEFCGVLGLSVDKVDLDIANLRAFGEEALDSMSRMGIGYRELRQYRRLPEDQKQALIEVAKAGDKEGFVELAEELIARHAREKEAQARALQDAQDQAEDLAESKKAVEATVADLRRQARQLARATPDEVAARLRRQAQEAAQGVEAAILGPLRDGLEAIVAHGDGAGQCQRAWVQGQLETVLGRLVTVAGRIGLELQARTTAAPAWLDEAAIPGAAEASVGPGASIAPGAPEAARVAGVPRAAGAPGAAALPHRDGAHGLHGTHGMPGVHTAHGLLQAALA